MVLVPSSPPVGPTPINPLPCAVPTVPLVRPARPWVPLMNLPPKIPRSSGGDCAQRHLMRRRAVRCTPNQSLLRHPASNPEPINSVS